MHQSHGPKKLIKINLKGAEIIPLLSFILSLILIFLAESKSMPFSGKKQNLRDWRTKGKLAKPSIKSMNSS